MKNKYTMIIYWSEEDAAFVAEVPELPGCMADGATYQDAVANAEVIIQEWMATARELGRPIPEPREQAVSGWSVLIRGIAAGSGLNVAF